MSGLPIEARGLTKAYGKRVAVEHLDLAVAPGELVAIVGENGAGKSTALGMLSGRLVPDQGQALLGGHDVYGEPIAARRLLGFVGQELLLPSHLTVDEMAEFVCDLKQQPLPEAPLAQLLRLTGLHGHRDRLIGELSHGMQRKVAWVVALIAHPRALLLDEGLAGLDAASREALIVQVRTVLDQGAGVLWAEHDVEPLAPHLSRLVVLQRGRVAERHSGDEIRRQASSGRLAASMRRWTSLDQI